MQAIVCRYKYRHMKTRRFLYRFKAAVIDEIYTHDIRKSRKTDGACLQYSIFSFMFLFSQLKYPFSPSLFKAIDQFKPKFANTFIEVI